MGKRSNNQVLLDSILTSYQESNKLETIKESFDFFSIEQITKNFEITNEEINDSIIDGGNDGGIDSILFFCNREYFDDIEVLKEKTNHFDVEIMIIQNKNSESIEEDVLTRMLSTSSDVFNLSNDDIGKEYSVRLIDKVKLIRDVWKLVTAKHNTLRVNIFYISKGEFIKLSKSFQNKKDQLKNILLDNDIGGDINLIGAKELVLSSRKRKDYSAIINFDQITAIKQGRGYIGFVKMNEYFDTISDDLNNLRDHIFEDNVRDHLIDREINKEILKTLKSEKKKNFWCLNNGITIIASKVTPMGTSLNLENMQIVNGLQTSYQIYNAKKENDVIFNDSHYLIVKVVEADDEDVRNDIIRSTNRQTSVEVAGFRALDKIQLDIDEFFKKEGFYYDRKKNYYKNKGIPTNKIISIQLVAQSIFSMVYREPALARSKPVSLLKEENNYKRAFKDIGDNLWLFLSVVKIFKKVYRFLKKLKLEYKNQKNKDVEKIIASIYRFHICRILMSILMERNNFKIKDLVEKKELIRKKSDEDIDDEINKAFEVLVLIIKQYQKENKKTDYDLISISKNPSFDKVINKELAIKYFTK